VREAPALRFLRSPCGALAAVDPIVHLGGSTADALNVPAPPLEDVVLPALVDECAQGGQPFVLVLDDVYLVTEARCHKIIDDLSQRLPVGCQLALATRRDPALPLATLRAHRRLVEVRVPILHSASPKLRPYWLPPAYRSAMIKLTGWLTVRRAGPRHFIWRRSRYVTDQTRRTL